MLEDEPVLGKPDAVDGSAGRGAGAWIPVVEWAVEAAGKGIIGLAAARAAAAVLDRLRNRGRDAAESEELQPLSLEISRGMAAAVAADHVASTFAERGPLTVEAVEEPSSIAGVKVFDLSYVGVEPWVVLLRNDDTERRYYVVVAPNGEIMGATATPLLDFEKMFLRLPEE